MNNTIGEGEVWSPLERFQADVEKDKESLRPSGLKTQRRVERRRVALEKRVKEDIRRARGFRVGIGVATKK